MRCRRYWSLLACFFVLSYTGCCCCSSSTVSTDDGEWVATGEDSSEPSDFAEPGDALEPPVVVRPDENVLPSGEPIAGGEFNKFFPDSTDELLLIYKQEKEGFAQANLSNDAAEVASLSISDTVANPEAREKYEFSEDAIGGFPAAAMGSKATGVLVGNRFQVSVRSLDDSFTEADRRAWLEKFNLTDLSKLQ